MTKNDFSLFWERRCWCLFQFLFPATNPGIYKDIQHKLDPRNDRLFLDFMATKRFAVLLLVRFVAQKYKIYKEHLWLETPRCEVEIWGFKKSLLDALAFSFEPFIPDVCLCGNGLLWAAADSWNAWIRQSEGWHELEESEGKCVDFKKAALSLEIILKLHVVFSSQQCWKVTK